MQVVNQKLMMSHLHHMTSYSRTQQMMNSTHPVTHFIVQVCRCVRVCVCVGGGGGGGGMPRVLSCNVQQCIGDINMYFFFQTLSRYTSDVEQLVHTVDKRCEAYTVTSAKWAREI